MIVHDITIYIIPTHTIDDIHTPVSSGIRNPLPLSDHTTVSFRSLQMTVLLIPFLPTGKIGPTKIPLTPVISEMLQCPSNSTYVIGNMWYVDSKIFIRTDTIQVKFDSVSQPFSLRVEIDVTQPNEEFQKARRQVTPPHNADRPPYFCPPQAEK